MYLVEEVDSLPSFVPVLLEEVSKDWVVFCFDIVLSLRWAGGAFWNLERKCDRDIGKVSIVRTGHPFPKFYYEAHIESEVDSRSGISIGTNKYYDSSGVGKVEIPACQHIY